MAVLGCLALVFAAMTVAPAEARADKRACSTGHEAGQLAELDGRLREAIELFKACSSTESCPQMIRDDCTKLHEKATDALPTVTFSVMDGARELTDVSIFDGELLVVHGLDGRAIGLDPGPHHLKVVLSDRRVLESDVVLRQGEKNRLLVIRVPQAARGAEPSSGQGALHLERATSRLPATGQKVIPPALWVASGIGIGSLAIGTTFAVVGRSREQRVAAAVRSCAPSCSQSFRLESEDELNSARTEYLIANTALGLAGAAAVGVVVTYLLAPRTTSGPTAKRMVLRQLSLNRTSRGFGALAGFSF
jgi:hypothetical protein